MPTAAARSLPTRRSTRLLYSSEGWFSAVYLNLRTLSEQRRAARTRSSDIYATFTAAMIDPLPATAAGISGGHGACRRVHRRRWRSFVTGDADAERMLAALTAQNAFVKRLPDGVTYRFHHMMKECAERSLPDDGDGDAAALLGALRRVVRGSTDSISTPSPPTAGAGTMTRCCASYRRMRASCWRRCSPEDVLAALDECPADVLKAHPLAILVLMRSMFNWRNIPKMLELKALLLDAIAEHPELSTEERGNLLGECDLIMSFLLLQRHQRHEPPAPQRQRGRCPARPSASAASGGWTFGSPSVLMMFYRAPGELESELREMDECMPHYYKITNGHGQGAERIMRAEAAFMQGRFTDAHIALESAYAQIEGNGQENMALCCDFLARRLSLYAGRRSSAARFDERYAELLRQHNAAWINIWSATAAYYYALRGETEQTPGDLRAAPARVPSTSSRRADR